VRLVTNAASRPAGLPPLTNGTMTNSLSNPLAHPPPISWVGAQFAAGASLSGTRAIRLNDNAISHNNRYKVGMGWTADCTKGRCPQRYHRRSVHSRPRTMPFTDKAWTKQSTIPTVSARPASLLFMKRLRRLPASMPPPSGCGREGWDVNSIHCKNYGRKLPITRGRSYLQSMREERDAVYISHHWSDSRNRSSTSTIAGCHQVF